MTASSLAPTAASARRAWGRFPRIPVSVVIAMVFVAAFAVAAIFGPALVTQDPDRQDLVLGASGPVTGHWLGTDGLGRDVFTRLIVSTGSALVGPLVVAIVTMLLGSSLGLVAGTFGGRVDAFISRTADLIWSLPGLLVAIVVLGVMEGGMWLAILVVAFLSIPHAIRQSRSATLTQASRPYVESARTLGLGRATIIRRHLLPNVGATVFTTALLDFVTAILIFAALAFLRIGVEPGVASWGAMLAEGQSLIYVNPLLITAPAVAIIAIAASVTIIGDWAQSVAAKEDRR